MSGLNISTLKPGELTWDSALRLFMLRCRSKNISPGTLELYELDLGAFRRWLSENGDPKPGDVQPQHLRAYLEACKVKGNKPLTVDCIYRILRTFWRFLLNDGLTLLDPMEKVERPRRERRFVKPITEEQLRLLLTQMDTGDTLGARDHALTLFLADTGLRISEALSLRIKDIEWAGNTVAVLGKGRKERRVAFGQTAKKALLSWIQRRGVTETDAFLWVNRYNEQMRRMNFQQRIKQYSKRAGIAAQRLSPHALRHFFALQFLKNGGDAMSLQKLLGHSSLEMVRNYVNMTDDDALAKHRQASPLDRMGPLPGERRQVRLK